MQKYVSQLRFVYIKHCLLMFKMFVLTMFIFIAPACSDSGDPDSYVGTWISDFNDTDRNGHKIGEAWRLTIKPNHNFILHYKYRSDGDWGYSDSGKAERATIKVDGFDKPGIRFGRCYGTFYSGNMDAMIKGELRTFKHTGKWVKVFINISLIYLAIVFVKGFISKKT